MSKIVNNKLLCIVGVDLIELFLIRVLIKQIWQRFDRVHKINLTKKKRFDWVNKINLTKTKCYSSPKTNSNLKWFSCKNYTYSPTQTSRINQDFILLISGTVFPSKKKKKKIKTSSIQRHLMTKEEEISRYKTSVLR